VTRTPLPRSKRQRSRSPGRFTHRRVGASGGCSGGSGNVLAVGNCCYVAVCSAAQGASGPRRRRGAGAYRGGRPPTACLQRDGNREVSCIGCSSQVSLKLENSECKSHCFTTKTAAQFVSKSLRDGKFKPVVPIKAVQGTARVRYICD